MQTARTKLTYKMLQDVIKAVVYRERLLVITIRLTVQFMTAAVNDWSQHFQPNKCKKYQH